MSRVTGPLVPVEWCRDPKITPTERSVLLALLSHRNNHPPYRCDPSQDRLADETGLSIDTVQRALRAARRKGLVTWQREHQRARNAYSFPAFDAAPTPGQRGRTDAGSEAAPVPGHEAAPVRPELPEEELVKGTRARASRSPSPGDAPLAGMPEPEPPTKKPVEPNAGHLVAAWVDGFTEQRGKPPHDSVVRRVAGNCKQVARTCHDAESWRTAWHAAKDAGRRGQYDVVAYLADYQSPSRGLSNAEGYMRLVADLADPPLGYPYADPPELEGPSA